MTKKDAAITGLPRHIEIKIKAVYSSLKSAEKKAADFFAEGVACTLQILYYDYLADTHKSIYRGHFDVWWKKQGHHLQLR